VDAARFHLGEVGEQARQQLIGTTDEAARGGEQVRVGEHCRRRAYGSRRERTFAERTR
jgi:hypothetical protein